MTLEKRHLLRIAFMWTLTLVCLFSLSSCSSTKKSVKKRSSYEEVLHNRKEIEKEAEKGLKGSEKKIVEEAFEWLGTKYEFGKQDKGKSTDCSGMVMVIFEKVIGCKLPRNSAKQAEYCTRIKERDAKPGDLVFFITNSGDRINHVGIMIDAIQFIHAGTKGVTVSSLDMDYYRKHLQMVGRVPCLHN